MPMKLRCTYHTNRGWEEVDCSSELGKMMVYFREAEKIVFSNEDLSHLGITVVNLPGVESLLTGDHFRPYSTFGPEDRDDESLARELELYGKLLMSPTYPDIINTLRTMASGMFEEELRRRDIVPLPDHGPFSLGSIWEPRSHYSGITEGIYVHENDYGWPSSTVGVSEWTCLPTDESEQIIRPPHLRIEFGALCSSDSTGLFKREIIIIITAIYNRVHEPGFENETQFPVLFCSGFRDRMGHIIEALYDKSHDKLTLKVSPLYSFLMDVARDNFQGSPWDVFLRIISSSPRVNVTDKNLSACLGAMKISPVSTEDGST